MTDERWPLSEGDDALLLHTAEWAWLGEWPERIGVAVSGGSDSMALLHLFASVQAQRRGTVHAVTVDHRLRPEAAEEARFVARFCAGLGISHDTLVWRHGEIAGNLQDQARRARYGLIVEWARGQGIGHVVLGHTADDQAETFLMGLAREAGVDGLSGMRRAWEEGDVKWARPYLLTPRQDLRDYLVRNGIGWVDDPSNADDHFTRVKARKVLKALKPLGITIDKLSGTIVNLSIAQGALRRTAAERARQIAKTTAGEVVFDRNELCLTDQEITRRILKAVFLWVGGADYAPRADALFRIELAIRGARGATLAGVRLVVKDTEVRFTREPKAVAHIESPTDVLWDKRWRLTGPHDSGLTVRALGADGLRQCPDWRATGHSRAALIVSPAIWRGENLVAAPVAGMPNDWTAEIATPFHSFLFPH